MVAIPNRWTFSAFFHYTLPLLWAGSCVLCWAIFSSSTPENAAGKGVQAIFSMLSPFLTVAILVVLLNIWFGKRIYGHSGGWLYTEKRLFGFRWGAFQYDLDLLTECRACFIDGKNLQNREELERLRGAGAVIRRRGKRGPEYVMPCWACRVVYDNQKLIFLVAPSEPSVKKLADSIEAVMRLHRERRN